MKPAAPNAPNPFLLLLILVALGRRPALRVGGFVYDNSEMCPPDSPARPRWRLSGESRQSPFRSGLQRPTGRSR